MRKEDYVGPVGTAIPIHSPGACLARRNARQCRLQWRFTVLKHLFSMFGRVLDLKALQETFLNHKSQDNSPETTQVRAQK